MKQIKWFWPWQDEKEEQWLNDQALNGFTLNAIIFPSTYVFTDDHSKKSVCYLDYYDRKKEDLQEFMFTRNKAGWFFIGTMHGWHYFVTNKAEEPSVLRDAIEQNKKEKYLRQMGLLARFMPIIIIWFPIVSRSLSSPQYELTAVLAATIGVIYSWLTIKVYQRIVQLRK
jgi:hypothetical protein